jgi:hypothetical protein
MKESTSEYWLSMMVSNAIVATDSLQIKESGQTAFRTVPRANYNQFETTPGVKVAFPIVIRVKRYGFLIS